VVSFIGHLKDCTAIKRIAYLNPDFYLGLFIHNSFVFLPIKVKLSRYAMQTPKGRGHIPVTHSRPLH
jgi:hypothetical protein